jgi:hypothetical protein
MGRCVDDSEVRTSRVVRPLDRERRAGEVRDGCLDPPADSPDDEPLDVDADAGARTLVPVKLAYLGRRRMERRGRAAPGGDDAEHQHGPRQLSTTTK